MKLQYINNIQIINQIRFNTKTDDQKRVVTPKQAYKNGSDWLVIGRPITKGNIRKNVQTLIDHLGQ